MTPYLSKQHIGCSADNALKRRPLILKSLILPAFIFITSFHAAGQNVVDATTMNNKVMAGYQGWFRMPADPLGNDGYHHTFNPPGFKNTSKSLSPTDPALLAFDTWPDISEYSGEEKYTIPGYTYPDGKPAQLYSAQNYKTVLRHFEWMKQYGVDGVWLSEFCGHFPGGNQQADTTFLLKVMHNVQAAASATGRTWAFMWDMSGFNARNTKAEVYNIIINQWKKMVDEGVATDPRYMHHNGKPVLLIWGFFPNRPASQPGYMQPVVDFLSAPGKYQAAIVGGVETKWRTEGTPEFLKMLESFTAIQPWSVGRRVKDPATGYWKQNMDTWAGDIAWCKARNIIFQPVFNSGTHIAGPPPIPPAVPIVPRRTGNYLWEQFVEASKTQSINGAFVAMFDEVNEGTQIMKINTKPPVEAPFLTYDGATSDYYLRLVGTGARMLKNRIPITPVIPISPFSTDKRYSLKNQAMGTMLISKGKTIKDGLELVNSTATANSEWQISYDNSGYFIIKNRLSGKLLAVTSDAIVQADSKTDNAKWHLEWDGTGFCRIVNKATGKAMSNGENTAVQLKADAPGASELRWKITEL